MKRMITWFVACSLSLITWGCSSLPGLGNKDDKMVEITASKTNEVPAWFLEKETDNSTELTVTATDVSKDMQFAIDKATLNAKIGRAHV